MSESLSHDLREAWRQLRITKADLAALCLESAGALEKAEAEVRRLREREAKARELAEKFIRSMDGATGTIGQAIAATEIRDGLRHWLDTE